MSSESVQWASCCFMHTGRHDKAVGRFSQFCERAYKKFSHFILSITDVWQLPLFCVFNINGFWVRRFGILPSHVIVVAVSSRQLLTLWNISLTRQFASCRLMFSSSVFRVMAVKNMELPVQLWSQSCGNGSPFVHRNNSFCDFVIYAFQRLIRSRPTNIRGRHIYALLLKQYLNWRWFIPFDLRK